MVSKVLAVTSDAKSSGGALGPDAKQGRSPLQSMPDMQNFFTKTDWAAFGRTSAMASERMHTMVRRLRLLGLNNPNERTFVRMVALLLVSAGMDESSVVPMSALSMLRDMKRIFRSYRLKHGEGLVEMPSTPAELRQALPEAFALAYSDEAPPIESQVDTMLVERVITMMPMRSSRFDSTALRPRGHADPLQQMCSMMMQRMMQSGDSGLPGFKWLGAASAPDEQAQQVRLPTFCTPRRSGSGSDLPGQTTPPPVHAATPVLALGDTPAETGGLQATAPQKNVADVVQLVMGKLKAQTKGNAHEATAVDEDGEDNGANDQEEEPRPTLLKRPASRSTVGPLPKRAAAVQLKFPGTQQQDPIRYGLYNIYTATRDSAWRVKKQGERVDKQFSWKVTAPEDIWAKVVRYVQSR